MGRRLGAKSTWSSLRAIMFYSYSGAPGGRRMSRLTALLSTAVLASLLTTSFMMILSIVPETVSAYTVRSPIYICGDAEFTSANGVTAGSGTASDPYLIEGWEIDATTAHGIWIVDTNAHFTILSCYVHDGGTDLHGIYLHGCTNCTVTGNTCSNNYHGILLTTSNNNTLSDNNCSSNNDNGIMLHSSSNNALSNNHCSLNGYHEGIYLGYSNNNTLSGNTCSNNIEGIWLYASDNNTLSRNTFSNNDIGVLLFRSGNNTLSDNDCSSNDASGIQLYFSSNNTLSDNDCSSNGIFIGMLVTRSNNNTLSSNDCSSNGRYGIHLDSSGNNTLSDNNCSSNNDNGIMLLSSSNNTLSDNDCRSNSDDGILLDSSRDNTLNNNNVSSNGYYGVFISASTRTTIYRNIFFDNAYSHAHDSSGSKNHWNASYPIGGNYWDDYAGVDEFSGPSQDLLGPDGIGDTPYEIGATGVDNYPLMEPPNTPPTATFTVSPSTGYLNAVFSIDASSSSDAEDDLSELEVRWDWESDRTWDTSWTIEKTDTHQYSAEGTYAITLEVRDTEGLTDCTTREVTVVPDDVPPVADAGSNQTVTVGDEVTFDGSGSSDNVGIENYTWTFTYTGEERENYGVAPTFTFNIAGTYVVTLTVEDAEGGTDMDNVTIAVEEEEQEEDEEEDGKSFLESYGLPIGIVVALAIVALILFFVLKGRKSGKAPVTLVEPPEIK
jgi:parallel beta-helix repeat protein